MVGSAPFTSNSGLSVNQLFSTKVYKTILCKIITTEAGVGDDLQLSVKVTLHKVNPPLLDMIIFCKFK